MTLSFDLSGLGGLELRKTPRGVASIFQKEGGGGGHTVSNRGYSPDLLCRSPRCVLLNVTFLG